MIHSASFRSSIFSSLLLVSLGTSLFAAEPATTLPERFRDVKMYSFSKTDLKDSSLILVRTKVRNEGTKPLDVHVTLDANDNAGFSGSEFKQQLAAGAEVEWSWRFRPPTGFRREVLRGTVSFGGKLDRDLFVALQAENPAGLELYSGTKIRHLDSIKDKAAVVATYLPRRPESVRASRKARKQTVPVMTLATKGVSKYRIVLPEKIGPSGKSGQPIAEMLAAQNLGDSERQFLQAVADLQNCLKVQSSTELPVVAAADSAAPAIRLREDSSHSLRTKWGHPDAYSLSTERNGDVLIAAETLDGLRHGIYGLLTDHLDCHWFQPGKIGEEIVVPADRTVRLPELQEFVQPSFFSVGGVSWGSSRDWDCRNRSLINRGRMAFGHSWFGYLNNGDHPYDKFPDMYARDRQGRVLKKDTAAGHTNFCSTNPEVIDIVARKVNAAINGNKETLVVSLDPEDYSPMCLCDRCLALDAKYGQTRQDGTEVADRLLHFSNEVYQRLNPENKHVYLGILIYGYQMELPISAKAHPHHAGMICNFPPRYDHTRPINDPTSEMNRDFLKLVKGWGSLLKQLGYYDYYGHWYYFGPWGMVHKMREDLPVFRELGGTFLMLEAQPNFASQGINHYIASRLAWNLDEDVDVLLDEFFEKYYGPAETAMRNYWLGAERQFALARPGTHAERATQDPLFETELGNCLKQAEESVAPANIPQRYKDRVAFARDGFDYWLATGKLRRQRRGVPMPVVKGAEREKLLNALSTASDAEMAMKKKYSDTKGYYPLFLPNYFWPDFASRIAEVRAMK